MKNPNATLWTLWAHNASELDDRVPMHLYDPYRIFSYAIPSNGITMAIGYEFHRAFNWTWRSSTEDEMLFGCPTATVEEFVGGVE